MMRIKYPIVLYIACLLLLSPISSFASSIKYNDVYFKQIDLFDGLPHNTINSITQDDRGFMWFGTRNGLSRYDGNKITNYFCNENDSASISHNLIMAIHNDAFSNSLWVTTQEGLCRYMPDKDAFVRYADDNQKGYLQCRAIINTHDGKTLIANQLGVFVYNKSADKFQKYIDVKLPVFDLLEDDFKNLWIATSSGLMCYDPKNNKPCNELIPESPYKEQILSQACSQLFIDSHKRIWVKTRNKEVFVINTDLNIITKFNDLGILSMHDIMSDVDGNIWLGTESGIHIFNYELERIRHIQHDKRDNSKLNDNSIYCLYADNSDNIWVGTYFGGVNLFLSENQKFRITKGDDSYFLSGKAVRKIIPGYHKDELFLATEDGGLNMINCQTGKITTHQHFAPKMGLESKNIHSLLLDKNRNLWVGSLDKGLVRYEPSSGRTKNVRIKGQRVACFDLIQDTKGDIWAATTIGLVRYDKSKDSFEAVEWLKGLSKFFVFRIITDKVGNLWAGTRNSGLFKIDLAKKRIVPILPQKKLTFVSSLFEDKRGNIWVGSDIAGLLVINKRGKLVREVKHPELRSVSYSGLGQDDKGHMWITTSTGLFKLHKGEVTKYTTAEGLPVNQFNYNSLYKNEAGDFYMGTINGLVSFSPDDMIGDKPIFKIELTDLQLNNNENATDPNVLLGRKITEADNLTLNYEQARSVRISYSGVNYRYGLNTQYAVKIDGIDSEWENVGMQSQLLLSNLDAGKYVLRIKASADGKNWDEQHVKTLSIQVNPPWWESNIAYAGYLIIICLIVYVIFYYSRSRMILNLELKTEQDNRAQIEELNQQKINFFTYLSHDLKTPLTLILSPLERIIRDSKTRAENKEKLSVILRNAQRMQRLIEDLKTFSQIEMKQQKIRLREGNVLLFLKETSLMFEMIAKEREIDFVVRINADTESKHWFSPSKLERIIYNLLSNAFKYTASGGMVIFTATVESSSEGNFCEIIVEDTGRGFPQEFADKVFENYYQVSEADRSIGSGIGLALTKMLVKLHHGTIKVNSKPGVGSVFTARINVSKENYSAQELSDEPIIQNSIEQYSSHMSESVELIDMPQVEFTPQYIQRKTVMVVEDNKEMNAYVSDILSDKFEIINAFDGEQGFEIATAKMPDLIISDVMMPRVDGLEMTQKLKQDLSTAHIPIVLLTAKTEGDDMTQGYLHGADSYLTKPFTAQHLELLVGNILRTREKQISLFHHEPEAEINDIASNPRDVKFMSELLDLIMKNLDNSEFSVTDITSEMCISRSLLHNKIKGLADVSITEFIRSIRMKEGKKLLKQGMNVSETAYAVGISDPNYFTKCFKKQFNITPSDYLKELG